MLSRRLLRVKVVKGLYTHFKSESESLIVSEKNILNSIDKTYDLYHQLLWLVADVMRYAEKRIEIGRQKKLPTQEDLNPNTKFIENRVIRLIESSDSLSAYLGKRSLGWNQYPELVKSIYNSMIDKEYYKAYMEDDNRSFKDDQKFVENFFLNEIEDNEIVENIVEEQSILWADDIDFALIMIVRTIGNLKPSHTDVQLLPKYKNEEDREFVKDLFRSTLVNYGTYIEYIDEYTSNWDVERIAFMDNLIMATAVSEMINIPSVPVNVTLDEYIEIAKYYSTPASSLFINGVLDKLSVWLKNEGKINKSGRGLL